ncbi:phosphoglycerate dehydrogenase [Kwoniella heveanensis BCC8398]|uniref:Phosphoglycerate dehydrogenase n=1 Tax=Kwoniella heveanensis BCC8398 TaxID=1296120 RepID=A0A1B9GKB1_9TREE|nr:phosphoglycerate dehydrogenase [Kwoniella heveanensis BCC8398]
MSGFSAKPKTYMLDLYHADAQELFQQATTIDGVMPQDPRCADWHSDAEALIIRSETKLRREDFEKAKHLKIVTKQGVGVDNIDLDAAKEHGVQIFNTPAVNSETVAEMALALGLALARRITEFDRVIRAGEKVQRSKMLGIGLRGKTVGIVGMGNIARFAANKWIGAVEANIVAYDPYAPADAWSDIPHHRAQSVLDLIEKSHVITLHVPLTDSTRHIIGEKELAAMKPDAILLNTARGGLVDEAALLKTLNAGGLWGVALDAQDIEPPTREVHGPLLDTGKVILTPHVGGSTNECQILIGTTAVRVLLAALAGEPEARCRVV